MFDPNDWHIAKLNWSDFYTQPFYNTNLSTQMTNDHGERLSMTDATYTRKDDTPNARLYFGSSLEDYENGDDFAYICLDPSWDKSRIMTTAQYDKATKAVAEKAKQDSQSTQASA